MRRLLRLQKSGQSGKPKGVHLQERPLVHISGLPVEDLSEKQSGRGAVRWKAKPGLPALRLDPS